MGIRPVYESDKDKIVKVHVEKTNEQQHTANVVNGGKMLTWSSLPLAICLTKILQKPYYEVDSLLASFVDRYRIFVGLKYVLRNVLSQVMVCDAQFVFQLFITICPRHPDTHQSRLQCR